MSEPPDQWLPLSDAAARLGIAENALRSRIKRRSIRARKDNNGRLMVCLPSTEDRTRTMVRSRSGPGPNHTIEPSPEPRQSVTHAPEPAPLSVPIHVVEALQAAHRESLAAVQTQVVQLRADMAEQQARHDTEMARQLAERDSLHLDTLGRMQAQATMERALWLERIDAAEIRAERVEQRLDQVLDVLLTERRPRVESEVDHAGREPWWRRWFGQSSRSTLGGG